MRSPHGVGTRSPIKPFKFEQSAKQQSFQFSTVLLSAAITGQASVQGTVGSSGLIVSSISGHASESGTLKGTGALAGSVLGHASESGVLLGRGVLVDAISGRSSVSGAATGSNQLAASVTGHASESGTLKGSGILLGTIIGHAFESGVLKGSGIISGAVIGRASESGTLKGTNAISGSVIGHAAQSGTLKGSGTLSGSAVGHASELGLLKGVGALVDTIQGRASISGTASSGTGQQGNASGHAIVSGLLKAKGISTASVLGHVAVSGTTGQPVPPPPVPPSPIILGQGLRSFGVSASNPAVIQTASNDLKLFQSGSNKFLIVPGGVNLFKKSYHIVAMGDVVVPSSGTNVSLNIVLTLKGFSQEMKPEVAIFDDVLAYWPLGQSITTGTTVWKLVCNVSAIQDGVSSFQSNKRAGRLVVDYIMLIGGSSFEGTLVSGNNPFLQPMLQFSLGMQFTGSVSGLDKFQADLYQFETQK